MLSVYSAKPGFQRLLQPVVGALAKQSIHPNSVTLAAFLASGAGGLSILLRPDAAWPLLMLPVLLFLRMSLNAIDGQLARQCRLETRLGLLLNELGDVVSDCILYLPLALVPSLNATGVVLLCVLSVISEMAGILAWRTSGVRSYAGPMGKSDRALAIGMLSLTIGLGVNPGLWSDAMLIIVDLLLIVTIINRSNVSTGR
jgi:CDP-diacylglycerol--glycerol-3-phosphate 3-phosphatidyltransferase